MTDLGPFSIGILSVTAFVALTCRFHHAQYPQMARTMAAIFANWVAGLIYVHVTGDLTPWYYNIVIDAIAAFVVMYHPAGKVQGYIGLFYFFQLAGHIAFGLRRLFGQPSDPVFYYDAITWVAWAQLAAMGLWGGTIWIVDLVHRVWDYLHASHRQARGFHHRGKL